MEGQMLADDRDCTESDTCMTSVFLDGLENGTRDNGVQNNCQMESSKKEGTVICDQLFPNIGSTENAPVALAETQLDDILKQPLMSLMEDCRNEETVRLRLSDDDEEEVEETEFQKETTFHLLLNDGQDDDNDTLKDKLNTYYHEQAVDTGSRKTDDISKEVQNLDFRSIIDGDLDSGTKTENSIQTNLSSLHEGDEANMSIASTGSNCLYIHEDDESVSSSPKSNKNDFKSLIDSDVESPSKSLEKQSSPVKESDLLLGNNNVSGLDSVCNASENEMCADRSNNSIQPVSLIQDMQTCCQTTISSTPTTEQLLTTLSKCLTDVKVTEKTIGNEKFEQSSSCPCIDLKHSTKITGERKNSTRHFYTSQTEAVTDPELSRETLEESQSSVLLGKCVIKTKSVTKYRNSQSNHSSVYTTAATYAEPTHCANSCGKHVKKRCNFKSVSNKGDVAEFFPSGGEAVAEQDSLGYSLDKSAFSNSHSLDSGSTVRENLDTCIDDILQTVTVDEYTSSPKCDEQCSDGGTPLENINSSAFLKVNNLIAGEITATIVTDPASKAQDVSVNSCGKSMVGCSDTKGNGNEASAEYESHTSINKSDDVNAEKSQNFAARCHPFFAKKISSNSKKTKNSVKHITSSKSKRKLKLPDRVKVAQDLSCTSENIAEHHANKCEEQRQSLRTLLKDMYSTNPGSSKDNKEVSQDRLNCSRITAGALLALLNFTFNHEQFPSSANMASLAKIIDKPWHLVRNWFHKRRELNKKMGLYPRNKPLNSCVYCPAFVSSSAKSASDHLFNKEHIMNVLNSSLLDDKQEAEEKIELIDTTEELSLSTRKYKKNFCENKQSNLVTDASGGSGDAQEKIAALQKSADDNLNEKKNAASGVPETLLENGLINVDGKYFRLPDITITKYGTVSSPAEVAKETSTDSQFNPHSLMQVKENQVRSFNDEVMKKVTYSDSTQAVARMHKLHNTTNLLDDFCVGFRCPQCLKIFQTEWLLTKHSLYHYMFLCSICEEYFPSDTKLKSHMIDHILEGLEGCFPDTFYCSVCKSLKCVCDVSNYYQPRLFSPVYARPQKAKRSKKSFTTILNSGMNDHLKVTYAKLKQENYFGTVQPLQESPLSISATTKPEALVTSLASLLPKQEDSSVLQPIPVTLDKSKQNEIISNSTNILNDCQKEKENNSAGNQHKQRTVGQRRAKKTNYVYNDTDFFYLCELCDASFLSKAELNEHMFFHRLKSRSRRGQKHKQTEESEQLPVKKLKRDCSSDRQSEDKIEMIIVGGFERVQCPLCSGHFASVQDLKRHHTQAHKESGESLDGNRANQMQSTFLGCKYCPKLYKRERELRRHLRHDCSNAPAQLVKKLTVGVNLFDLEKEGDGAHYTVTDQLIGTSVPSSEFAMVSSSHSMIICKFCGFTSSTLKEIGNHVWMTCSAAPKYVKCRLKKEFCQLEVGSGNSKLSDITQGQSTTKEKSHNEPSSIPADVSQTVGNECTAIKLKYDKKSNSPKKKAQRFLCVKCHATYNTHEQLFAHVSIHDRPTNGYYRCRACLGKFSLFKHLHRHIIIHLSDSYSGDCDDAKTKPKDSKRLSESEENGLKEGMLDYSEANLDSIAEMMVVTDSDISNKETAQQSSDGKSSPAIQTNIKSHMNVTEIKSNKVMYDTVPKKSTKINDSTDSDIAVISESVSDHMGCFSKNANFQRRRLRPRTSKTRAIINLRETDESIGELLSDVDNIDGHIETVNISDSHLE